MSEPAAESRSRLLQSLDRLGRALDIDLTLGRDDSCFFEHEDGWQVAIMLLNETQVVTALSVLANVTAGDELVVPAWIELGWLGAQSGGAALSWNPESRAFVLWHARDADKTDAEELNRLLLELCRVAPRMQALLNARLYPQSDPDRAQRPQDEVPATFSGMLKI